MPATHFHFSEDVSKSNMLTICTSHVVLDSEFFFVYRLQLQKVVAILLSFLQY